MPDVHLPQVEEPAEVLEPALLTLYEEALPEIDRALGETRTAATPQQ